MRELERKPDAVLEGGETAAKTKRERTAAQNSKGEKETIAKEEEETKLEMKETILLSALKEENMDDVDAAAGMAEAAKTTTQDGKTLALAAVFELEEITVENMQEEKLAQKLTEEDEMAGDETKKIPHSKIHGKDTSWRPKRYPTGAAKQANTQDIAPVAEAAALETVQRSLTEKIPEPDETEAQEAASNVTTAGTAWC